MTPALNRSPTRARRRRQTGGPWCARGQSASIDRHAVDWYRQDGLATFEPAYVDELAVILRWAFNCMQRSGETEPDARTWLRDQTGLIVGLYWHYDIDAQGIMTTAQWVWAGRPLRHLAPPPDDPPASRDGPLVLR